MRRESSYIWYFLFVGFSVVATVLDPMLAVDQWFLAGFSFLLVFGGLLVFFLGRGSL
jgi:hypothetical protein